MSKDDTYDVMSLLDGAIIKDSCMVKLIDCCPRLCPMDRTVEFAAVKSARVSLGAGLKTIRKDNNLIDYLIKHKHTSPFESISFTFYIKCPLYISKQIMRHRTFSFNEFSMRYSEAKHEMYVPSEFRKQAAINKQSSDGKIKGDASQLLYEKSINIAYETYKKLIILGVCREQARGVLPVCTMTTFYATVNLNNLFKFLTLRMASDAQQEIQEVANAMHILAKKIAPIAFAAMSKYDENKTLQ